MFSFEKFIASDLMTSAIVTNKELNAEDFLPWQKPNWFQESAFYEMMKSMFYSMYKQSKHGYSQSMDFDIIHKRP